ncbi:MAG: ATP-binding protein [Bacteroidales bacterium]|nr:ATP-binding protein [Bacteroidales bacterium]
MDTAFPYSQYVTGKNFVGRGRDVTLLGNLLAQGEHIVLSEPPKTGKTSLVQQALVTMKMQGKSFSVGQFSALNIRTLEEMLLRYGSTVIMMAGSAPDEYASLVERYLGGTHFVFDPAAYAERGEVLSLSWTLEKEDVDAVIRFPFKLSADRGSSMFLIIDEFQCVTLLEDEDKFLVPLNAAMKDCRSEGLKGFSLILCGSGVNAMHRIFRSSLLFHRQVERVKLSPIGDREMADHVLKGFLAGGKVITSELMQGACRLFKGHPWYINHFCAICDSMTRGYIMEPVLVEALSCLISVHEPRFQDTVNGLTTHQVNFLKAVAQGVTRFSASEVIVRYDLHSSANVKRVKDALMKKEVLFFDDNDAPVFIDPLFEYWVKKYYFQIEQ